MIFIMCENRSRDCVHKLSKSADEKGVAKSPTTNFSDFYRNYAKKTGCDHWKFKRLCICLSLSHTKKYGKWPIWKYGYSYFMCVWLFTLLYLISFNRQTSWCISEWKLESRCEPISSTWGVGSVCAGAAEAAELNQEDAVLDEGVRDW